MRRRFFRARNRVLSEEKGRIRLFFCIVRYSSGRTRKKRRNAYKTMLVKPTLRKKGGERAWQRTYCARLIRASIGLTAINATLLRFMWSAIAAITREIPKRQTARRLNRKFKFVRGGELQSPLFVCLPSLLLPIMIIIINQHAKKRGCPNFGQPLCTLEANFFAFLRGFVNAAKNFHHLYAVFDRA